MEGSFIREERGSGPLVYQLSGKAMLGSHALKDKAEASKSSHPKDETPRTLVKDEMITADIVQHGDVFSQLH